jgi:hypothetical protein
MNSNKVRILKEVVVVALILAPYVVAIITGVVDLLVSTRKVL